MGLGTTTWLEAFPVVAVAVLLMVVPGALAARLIGTSWSTALCVGPLLTTTTLTVAGVVAPALGLRWSPWVMAMAAAMVLLVSLVLGRVLRPAPPHHDGDMPLPQLLVPALIALVAVAAVVIPATGSPTAFPQSPDTIFHLGTITWMLGRGDISVLHSAGFTSQTGTGFYPAAFHDFATTLAQLTGASPVVSASSTALVLGGLVWPLGLLLLGRRVLGPGWGPGIAAALGAAAFSAFPFWLMGYGVLWPNVHGQALLPAALALVVAVVDGPGRLRPALLVVAALPGLALAHPNAVIAFGLIGPGIIVVGVLKRAWQARRVNLRRSVALLAALAVGITLFAGAWLAATLRATSNRNSNGPGPEMTLHDGVIDALFFAPRNLAPLWAVGVLVAVGAVVLLVRRRQWWVIWAHLGVGSLYLLDVCVDSPRTRLLTWPWYNNSPRLAALMTLTGAVLFAAALTAGADALNKLVRRPVPTWLAPVAVATLAVVVTTGLGYSPRKAALDQYFDVPENRAFATAAELDGLKELGRKVPAGSVVAANPWKGATYLYLIDGQRLLFPTEKTFVPGDRALVGRHLDDAATDPAVCAAARRQGVDFVITGGTPMTRSAAQARLYRGIDDVPKASGFTKVASAAGYDLYRLDACD